MTDTPLVDELAALLKELAGPEPPCLCDDLGYSPEGRPCIYCRIAAALKRYDDIVRKFENYEHTTRPH